MKRILGIPALGVAVVLLVSACQVPVSCTTTVSSTAAVNFAIRPGATVCLAGGSYGALTLTNTPSSPAFVAAAPGAHVVVAGINIEASNLTVTQLHSTGGITVSGRSPYAGYHDVVIDHNDVTNSGGYGVAVLSSTSTPSYNILINGNRVHNTSTSGEGDAIRLDGWNHVVVANNDIYNIAECSSNSCHTDTLQSYQAGVPTNGLLLVRNYLHDTMAAQGFPFLKDGDIANAVITDNLAVRMSSRGETTGVWVDDNSHPLTITNNTYQSTTGSIVQSDGSTPNPVAIVSHNVFDALNVKTGSSGHPYGMLEDYDVFTANNEYTFNPGPHDSRSATFVNPSSDDYRLAWNPYGEGVDWRPADQQYGPAH
jgi:Right handed beta helix region